MGLKLKQEMTTGHETKKNQCFPLVDAGFGDVLR